MGHDQHGPAYPEAYSCPVCGWDATAYLRCNHPGCPDGRDRGHPDARESETGDPWLDQFLAGQVRKEARARSTGWSLAIAFGLVVLVIIVLSATPY